MSSKQRIEELEALVRYHQGLYDEAKPEITDGEFDALKDELRTLSPSSPVLDEIGFLPEWGTKSRHASRMGSLDKVTTADALRSWQADHCHDGSSEVVMTPKVDGLAVRLNYRDGKLIEAATRGDGEVGQDITANALAMKSVPNSIGSFTGEIRGEVYMSRSVFEKLRRDGLSFANPRNAAAGSLLQKDASKTAERDLAVKCYDVVPGGDMLDFVTEVGKLRWLANKIKGSGLEMVEYQLFSTLDSHLESVLYDWEHTRRSEIDYEIDGMVFALNDVELQESAGWAGTHHPRGKMAYKFKPEQKTAVVNAIDWQVGRTGKLTPVARIQPTEIAGSVVGNISLHNVNILHDLGVVAGCEVLFQKANDIIPQVVRVTGPSGVRATLPSTCPRCGELVAKSGASLMCVNDFCPARLEARVLHWLKRLGVLGVGPAIVAGLCERGAVKGLADLYRLDFDEVEAVTGGHGSAMNVIQAILEKNEIPLWQFLAALGIKHLGRTSSKAIAKKMVELEVVRNSQPVAFSAIDGIGDATAVEIVAGLSRMAPEIDDLLTAVDVIDVEETTGPLINMTFCITGALSKPRKEVAAEIEAAGGVVKSGVVKGLSYLVTDDPSSGSSKNKKASKLGVSVIDEAELRAMMGA